jgi:thymidylate synthase (FAD)
MQKQQLNTQVNLLFNTPLFYAVNAARFSHNNHELSDSTVDKLGDKDKELLHRVGVKLGHNTILRFITYQFEIAFTTKDLLAFSRHCMGIDMVMTSTRFALKKLLKNTQSFIQIDENNQILINDEAYERASKYIVLTGVDEIDYYNVLQLEKVRSCLLAGYSNDEVSTMLPQAWVYKGQIIINAQALRHLLELRLDKSAHVWIQLFAIDLYNNIPSTDKFLFEDLVKEYHERLGTTTRD